MINLYTILDFNTNNIFYCVASIIIGILLIIFAFLNKKAKRVVFMIITLIHALLFIGFGIWGFFIPTQYESITILAILAFSITMIIFLLLFKRKDTK